MAIVLELELKDGSALSKDDRGIFDDRPLWREWIGYYLDGGGEGHWLDGFTFRGAEAPEAAYTRNLRAVEVLPDGRRLLLWDWKRKPQEPASEPSPPRMIDTGRIPAPFVPPMQSPSAEWWKREDRERTMRDEAFSLGMEAQLDNMCIALGIPGIWNREKKKEAIMAALTEVRDER